MAFQNHDYLLERCVSSPFTDTINGHFHLTCPCHHAVKGIRCRHSQVIMTMGGDDGLIDIIDMLFQIFDLLEIFLWKTIARSIRYIHYCSSCLNHSFYHLSEIFIVCSSCIFAVELYIINKSLGIFRSRNGTL